MMNNATFQNAHDFTIKGNPSFKNQNVSNITNVYGGGKADGLEYLNGFISFDAQFDSSAQDPDRQCHPGTRENVLKRLRDWVDDPSSKERIFWLYGPAGAGKSAIAQTIAHSYAQPNVAATFFFFRSDINRNDGNRLFTTLAYQIALSMPEIKEYIAHSLFERPDLPRKGVEMQFDQLIARPFQVLSDEATQQWAPAVAVQVIIDIVKRYQKLAPVIIIDGVDECTDEKTQRRFLKIIDDAVKDDRLPFRFLIVSRPEFHIEQTISRFQSSTFRTDLAKLDDANRDIEKYLVDEFSRIASEQGLDPTWPGKKVIDDILYKSSGNFIFASLVIRFVDDPYYLAKTQLDIVLNIEPPKTMSPFTILDQLFMEILKRVPDQKFLKRYLALLVARISISSKYGELYKDDAVLMHVSEAELHVNLRRMRSLLNFEPFIDIHHKSFLDFLYDSSRSSEYHIREQHGIKGYLKVLVDSLIRFVSILIKRPDHHNTPHFVLIFREKVKWYPSKIDLSAKEWAEVIQPLLDIQDKILQLPDFGSTRDILSCDGCTVFHLMRELMHLGLHLGLDSGAVSEASVRNLRKRKGVASLITTKTEDDIKDNNLDSVLLSLFNHLSETAESCTSDEKVVNLMNAVLHFDHAKTVTRVHFISDAQKLVDLLDCMIHTKSALRPHATRKAGLLALKSFSWVPIVPLSCLLNANRKMLWKFWRYGTVNTEILSQTILAYSVLDPRYIVPVLEVMKSNDGVAGHSTRKNYLTMYQLRQRSIPSPVTTIQIILRLAIAIQYLHSMGVILTHTFGSDDVFVYSGLRLKVFCLCSSSCSLLDNYCKTWFSPENNIFSFGCLFYEMYAGVDIWPADNSINSRRHVISGRPSALEIPEHAWQLIQRCCAEDTRDRPTIDEVVGEIRSWQSVGHSEPDEVWNEMENSHCAEHVKPDEIANEMEGSRGVRHRTDASNLLCFGMRTVLSDLRRNLC